MQLASGHAVTNDIHWPVPKRFDAFGFDNFGYDNKVILPITLKGHPKGALSRLLARWKHWLVLIFACRSLVRSG